MRKFTLTKMSCGEAWLDGTSVLELFFPSQLVPVLHNTASGFHCVQSGSLESQLEKSSILRELILRPSLHTTCDTLDFDDSVLRHLV